jgi:hypothetical protein
MVSSEVIRKQLAAAYEILEHRGIDLHDYEGPMFDIAFDIVTLDTGIAGIAATVLSGQRVPEEHVEVLRRRLITKDGRLVLTSGELVDLSASPDLLEHVRLIDRVRNLCLRLIRK